MGLAFTLAHAALATAAPGDVLYVQQDGAEVRTGPGAEHSVLMTLNRGHELVEFSRRDSWINVGIARTGGKDGWIQASLVGPMYTGGATTAPPDPRFDAFVEGVEELNKEAEAIVGFRFFASVENLGDGMVQLIATRRWISEPEGARQVILDRLFEMWDENEGTGLPIAVYLVDTEGEPFMSKARQ
jgi:hypothetical protein